MITKTQLFKNLWGHSKGSLKRKVCSNTRLSQETRKVSNTQPNTTIMSNYTSSKFDSLEEMDVFLTLAEKLGLDFLCCSFSSSFRCRVIFCMSDLSCILRKAYITIYFPLRTSLLCSTDFELLCFHYHLFP